MDFPTPQVIARRRADKLAENAIRHWKANEEKVTHGSKANCI